MVALPHSFRKSLQRFGSPANERNYQILEILSISLQQRKNEGMAH